MIGTRESREMCQRGVCKYWAHDMDSTYCTHPKSFEIGPVFGASTNRMSIEGHCTGGYDDPSKNKRQFFEKVNK